MWRLSLADPLAALMGFAAIEATEAALLRLDIARTTSIIETAPALFELGNPTIVVGEDLFASFQFNEAAPETVFETDPIQMARFKIIGGALMIGGLGPINIPANPTGLGVRANEDERNAAGADGFEVLANMPGQSGSRLRARFGSSSDALSTPKSATSASALSAKCPCQQVKRCY